MNQSRTKRQAATSTSGLQWLLNRLAAAVFLLALPLAPTWAQSHLQQSIAEHVIIQFFGLGFDGACRVGGDTDQTLAFFRVDTHGNTAPFVIPKGKTLVVTDFNVTAHLPVPVAAGAEMQLVLGLKKNGKAGAGTIVYRNSRQLAAPLGSNNFSLQYQSLAGMAVADDASLCPQLSLDDGNAYEGGRLTVTSGNYRGYLIAPEVKR